MKHVLKAYLGYQRKCILSNGIIALDKSALSQYSPEIIPGIRRDIAITAQTSHLEYANNASS